MGDVRGFDGKLAVSAAGSVYTDVGGVTEVGFSHARGKIDVSDWDSSGWKENLVGFGEITLSFTHNYDEADAGQDIIRTAANAGSQLYFRYRPGGDGSGTKDEMIGKYMLDSYEDSSPNEGAVTSSGSASSTGAPTFQAQP